MIRDALDGSGLYTEQRNLALWQQVPAQLRLTEFSPRTLPDHPAFRLRLGCRPAWRGFDRHPLPEPMQRDVAYCVWRVIDFPGNIDALRRSFARTAAIRSLWQRMTRLFDFSDGS